MEYTVCFIFDSDLSHILLQEKQKTDFMGLWNGISGVVENTDPTIPYAAAREIMEKTGLSIYPEELRWICDIKPYYDYKSDAGECVVHFYAISVNKPSVMNIKLDAWEGRLMWFNTEAVLSTPVNGQIKVGAEHFRLAGDGDLQWVVNTAIRPLKGVK